MKIEGKLLTLKLGIPSFQKSIKVQEEIPEEEADRQFFRLNKVLIRKSAIYNSLISAGNAFKNELKTLTIPWPEVGSVFIVPDKLLPAVTALIDKFRSEWEEKVERFVAEYPELIEEAKAALGKYFDPKDYPSTEEIRSKFKFNYIFTEIELPEKVQEELKEQMLQQWQDVKEMATTILKN